MTDKTYEHVLRILFEIPEDNPYEPALRKNRIKTAYDFATLNEFTIERLSCLTLKKMKSQE